jgi:hypothetical protein
LGIALYRLARGDYYYTISEMTGFGVATVCNITIDVSQAIVNNLWKEAVSNTFPSTLEHFKDCALDMEEMWQFPLAFSALDGCHIPIKMPRGGANSAKEYHNFKTSFPLHSRRCRIKNFAHNISITIISLRIRLPVAIVTVLFWRVHR